VADNAQKTPLARSLNLFAENKIRDAIQLLGKALPASVVAVSGSIVTVKFEVNAAPFTLPRVTIPLFGPEYIRYPIQVGDKGMVIPADARLGGISGLGKGIASLALPANLSSLIFMPIANANWDASEDPNKIVLYGPNGAVLRSKSGSASVTVTDSEVQIVGVLKINGDTYLAHKHSGVQAGGGTSGGVVP
jgi:hypothetical protein